VTPAEVLVRAKHSLGLERMVTLATGDDQLNRAYAAEAIGEEVYADPAKRLRAVEVRASPMYYVYGPYLSPYLSLSSPCLCSYLRAVEVRVCRMKG